MRRGPRPFEILKWIILAGVIYGVLMIFNLDPIAAVLWGLNKAWEWIQAIGEWVANNSIIRQFLQ